ncbi:hypothetical protein OCU04_012016 [Sclerotinia nivalis]|uniref:Uncharacterized protein n=1 Tax=Sclerotinia nivalis TaxID=352851 RepID=A0A9X0AAA3_9HELO|nr:hypothetical protein OCU04_012016 [Sclerotinia nivalis]
MKLLPDYAAMPALNSETSNPKSYKISVIASPGLRFVVNPSSTSSKTSLASSETHRPPPGTCFIKDLNHETIKACIP